MDAWLHAYMDVVYEVHKVLPCGLGPHVELTTRPALPPGSSAGPLLTPHRFALFYPTMGDCSAKRTHPPTIEY